MACRHCLSCGGFNFSCGIGCSSNWQGDGAIAGYRFTGEIILVLNLLLATLIFSLETHIHCPGSSYLSFRLFSCLSSTLLLDLFPFRRVILFELPVIPPILALWPRGVVLDILRPCSIPDCGGGAILFFVLVTSGCGPFLRLGFSPLSADC